MSLVINANEGDEGALMKPGNGLLLHNYPDFKGSVILSPSNNFGNGSTNNELYINGTGFRVSRDFFNDLYQGNPFNGMGDVGTEIRQTFPNTSGQSNTMLLTTTGTFVGGEIVGKRNYFRFHGATHASSASTITYHITIQLGIVHLDGSINYFGTMLDGNITASNNGSSGPGNLAQELELLTNGVIVQAGDRPLVSISGYKVSGGASNDRYQCVSFGCLGSNEDRKRMHGFQISVE